MKLTQNQMVFSYLLDSFNNKKTKFDYIPTWEFVGEKYLKVVDQWVLMSYKCPTRLTDIFQDNEGLLERRQVKGKSGAKYYEYRLNPERIDIKDKRLKNFYKVITS